MKPTAAIAVIFLALVTGVWASPGLMGPAEVRKALAGMEELAGGKVRLLQLNIGPDGVLAQVLAQGHTSLEEFQYRAGQVRNTGVVVITDAPANRLFTRADVNLEQIPLLLKAAQDKARGLPGNWRPSMLLFRPRPSGPIKWETVLEGPDKSVRVVADGQGRIRKVEFF